MTQERRLGFYGTGTRNAVAALACDRAGRCIYVSLDRRRFLKVTHFPTSREEAESLVASAPGNVVSREQLVARHDELALLEIGPGTRPQELVRNAQRDGSRR